MTPNKREEWEREFNERFPQLVEFIDFDGDLMDRKETDVKDFIRSELLKAYERGKSESHNTEDGYCCACDYDIAGFEERLLKARQEERERIIEKLWISLVYSLEPNIAQGIMEDFEALLKNNTE